MNNSLRTRALTDGALMAVITALIGLVGFALPFMRPFTDMVWAVPIIIVVIRHGILAGTMSLAVAGIIMFISSNPFSTVLLIIQSGGLAILFGYAFKRELKPSLTIIAGTVVATVLFVVSLYLMFAFFGFKAVDFIGYLENSINPIIDIYKNLGLLNPATTGYTEEMARRILVEMIRIIKMLIPALIVLKGISTAFFNYMVAHILLGKLGISVPRLQPFREWRLPWWISYGVIFGYAAFLIGNNYKIYNLAWVGMNILFAYTPVLLVLGISVTYFYITKLFIKPHSRAVAAAIIFILFGNIVMFPLVATGFFDLLFNYRRLPGKD